MSITLDSLLPVDLATIGRQEEVTFDLLVAGVVPLDILVWVKFAGRAETLVAYALADGFFAPFATRSSVHNILGDGSVLRFVVMQTGGWEDDIGELKVCTTASFFNGTDFDLQIGPA